MGEDTLARIKANRDRCSHLVPAQFHDWLIAEVERLREKHEKERDHSTELGRKIDGLLTRIGGLEKALGEALNYRREIIALVVAGHSLHFFTDEQLRAAVEYANTRHASSYGMIWFTLNKLGIFRCEECDGGYVMTQGPDGEPDGDRCPGCHGIGAVVKKIGEEGE